MVQLFDKGEGVPASSEKGVKVTRQIFVASIWATHLYLLTQKTSKAPGDVVTSITKQDELFEKKKVVIEQLTNYWQCKVHSLPDKPALCWK